MFEKRKGILDRLIDVLLLVQAIVQNLICLLMMLNYNSYLLFDITISNQLGGELDAIFRGIAEITRSHIGSLEASFLLFIDYSSFFVVIGSNTKLE